MLDLNRERQQWKHEGVLVGIQKGIKEGLKEGRQKGRQEGQQEAVKNTAKRLLDQNILTDAQVANATGLSLEQVEAIKREL